MVSLPARAPRATLAIVLALTLLAGRYAATLKTDYDPRAFHPKNSPMVAATRHAEAVFGADDRTALVGVFDKHLFTVTGLARLTALTRALRGIAGVASVTSLATAIDIHPDKGDIALDPYLEPLPQTSADVARARARIMKDPILAGVLVAEDARATLIRVVLLASHTGPKRRAAVYDRIVRLLGFYSAPGLSLRLGGFPMVRVAYSREMLSQVGRLLGLSAVVLLVLLTVLLRSVSAALATLLTVAVANVWTHGLMGALGQPFTILSMLTPIIIMVVGVADAVHITLAWRRLSGDLTTRAAGALDAVFGPTALTSVTTAVGFLALLTARDVSMIRQYGVYTAVGVGLAWLSTVLVLPPLLALGVVSGPRPAAPWRRAVDAWMGRRLDHILAHPRELLMGAALLVALLGFQASRISDDARILDGLDPDHPIMKTYRALESHFGGSLPMQVVYSGDATDPQLIRHARDTVRWLRHHEGVGSAHGPAAIIARFQAAIEGDSPSSSGLPGAPAEAEAGSAPGGSGGSGGSFGERRGPPGADDDGLPNTPGEVAEIYMAASFGDPDPLATAVSEPDRMLRVRALLQERGARATLALQDALEADLASRPLPPGASVALAGTAYVAPRAWRRLLRQMAWGLLLAMGLVTAMFGVLFSSLRLALVTVIPNVVPLIAVLATMSALGIPIKGNNAVVFSIAYGLAVDDTIHMLAQLRRAYRAGLAWPEAIRRVHAELRGALTITSLVLAGGFSVLLLSSFEFTVTLGLQMVVTALSALWADLFLLPALLVRLTPPSSLSR